MWSEPSAQSFDVRGEHYLSDKKKYPASRSVCKLHSIDLVETEDLSLNVASCLRSKVQLAHQQGDASWFLVINFMFPGPPHLNFVIYFTGDQVSDVHFVDEVYLSLTGKF